MTEDDIDENEVLEAIRKIKLMFNDDDSQEHIFREPNGVFILIERQPNTDEDFNVSVFDFKEADDGKFPICKVMALGLLRVLYEDLEMVFSKGLSKLMDDFERETQKTSEGKVVKLEDYKNVKDKLPSLLNKLDRDMSGDDDNAG